MKFAAHGLLWLLVVLVGAASPGCGRNAVDGNGPTTRELTGGVTLDMIEPPDGSMQLPEIPDDPQATVFRVAMIDLPIDADMSPAWSLLGFGGLDGGEIRIWERNGIRVGTVDRFDLTKFDSRLPEALSFRKGVRVFTSRPRPLAVASQLPARMTTQIEVLEDEPSEVTLRSGKLQYHIALRRLPGGEVSMRITPHHFQPRSTFELRDPEAMALDGQTFEELALNLTLAPHQVLVIGLHRPVPTAPDSDEPEKPVDPRDDNTATDTSTEPSPDTDTSDQPTPEPEEPEEPEEPGTSPRSTDVYARHNLLPRLGTVMMTGELLGRPVQRLILLSPDGPVGSSRLRSTPEEVPTTTRPDVPVP